MTNMRDVVQAWAYTTVGEDEAIGALLRNRWGARMTLTGRMGTERARIENMLRGYSVAVQNAPKDGVLVVGDLSHLGGSSSKLDQARENGSRIVSEACLSEWMIATIDFVRADREPEMRLESVT